MLRKFSPYQYYTVEHDYRIDAPVIELLAPALELVLQYYCEKYAAKIQSCENLDDFMKALSVFLETNPAKNHENFRYAFLVGTKATHTIPIIYIKENNAEAFLCADSLGTKTTVFENRLVLKGINQIVANAIAKKSGVRVFLIEEMRQADLYSCATDTLVFCRDCVGYDKESNRYLIPDLLTRLTSRLSSNQFVKLPDELLKTAQLSEFIKSHKEHNNLILQSCLKRNETYLEFKQRYQQPRKNNKLLNSYLQMKSIKLANIVEIQFYLNQLMSVLDREAFAKIKVAFIQAAKNELHSQGTLFLNYARSGLYQFSEEFMQNAITPNQDKMRLDAKNLMKHSVFSRTIDHIIYTAETILSLVEDTRFWQQKTLLHYGVPEGIEKMQAVLKKLPADTSREGKINQLRRIAKYELNKPKSFFYLLTSFEVSKLDDITKSFYQFFAEDWLLSERLKNVCNDWDKYRSSIDNSFHQLKSNAAQSFNLF